MLNSLPLLPPSSHFPNLLKCRTTKSYFSVLCTNQSLRSFCLAVKQARSHNDCQSKFRFQKDDIPQLTEVLGILEKFVCPQGTVVNGIEGLCTVLKRFTYPCRYSDMIPRFGRPEPELSMITNVVITFIYDQHGHRISQWNDTLA